MASEPQQAVRGDLVHGDTRTVLFFSPVSSRTPEPQAPLPDHLTAVEGEHECVLFSQGMAPPL